MESEEKKRTVVKFRLGEELWHINHVVIWASPPVGHLSYRHYIYSR